jgi:Zn/Cd-binding protein ZinT
MRKIINVMFLFLLLNSCDYLNSNGPLVNRGTEKEPMYYVISSAKDGDETKKDIEFFIDTNIVEELKLEPKKIESICDQAVTYADWNAKFKQTYKYSGLASLTYDNKAKRINAFISGTAENAFGVSDKIYTTIPFDLDGKMILDKSGLPIIQ